MLNRLWINLILFILPACLFGQSIGSEPLQQLVLYHPDPSVKNAYSDKVMASGKGYKVPYLGGFTVLEEGKWTYYYYSGGIECEGLYKDGVKDGEWRYYDADGKLKSIRNYDARNYEGGLKFNNNMRTGIWKVYEGETVFSTTDYNKGVITNFYLDGKLAEQITFRIVSSSIGFQGKYQLRFGSYISYYNNGNKRLEGSFSDTSRVVLRDGRTFVAAKGVWTSYWPDGKPANFYNFSTGEARILNTEFMENFNSSDGTSSSGQRVWAELGELKDSYLPVGIRGWGGQGNHEDADLIVTMLDATDDILVRTGVWEFRDQRNILQSRLEYNPEFFGAVGRAEYYYPDGKIKSKGLYDERSESTGKWLFYFDNGNLSEVRHYVAGVLHGQCVNYFRNGNLLDSSNYSRGKIDGIKYLYHPSGKPLGEEYYSNGNFISLGTFYDESGNPVLVNGNGLKTEYHENGKPKFIGYFKDYKTDGLCRWYYKNGNQSNEEFRVNGASNGEFKVYFESGPLMQRGYRVNDLIEGKVEYFYPSGKVLGSIMFRNNDMATIGDFFTESGTPMLRDGTGTQISYGTNGRVNFKAAYRDYCRDGLAEWFHENGQLAEAVIYKYSEKMKPYGLRWKVMGSFTRDGKQRDGGTLDYGNGTWIRYDNEGKATTTKYRLGIKVD